MIQSLTHTNTKGETESNDSGESGSNIYQVKAGIRQTAPVYSAVLE